MNSEAQVAHGLAEPASASAEIMGGPDKPGHDDQRKGRVRARSPYCPRVCDPATARISQTPSQPGM
jgi:hypothetical protein